MDIHSRKLRDCLGCFTTGVAIASTIAPDQKPYGLTINSFSSVSLHPPLVLFSIDRSAASFEVFSQTEHFAINILTEQQRALSHHFALPNPDKWAGIPYRFAEESGCPVIDDVLATLECRREYCYEGGDHIIFVGRVIHFAITSENAAPLVYFQGHYRSLEEKG